MKKLFSRKFMPVRIGLLAVVGGALILNAMAHNVIGSEEVNVRAPELKGKVWLNTDKPVTLESRMGKVTLVEFWTFECINCRHNMPPIKRLYDKFHDSDVEFIGIHTPELPEEKVLDNVKKFVEKSDIKYPILIDNDSENWDRWHQEYWPAVYVVDKKGRIRFQWMGELGDKGEREVGVWLQKLNSE